ncbi:MAG: phage portal protein [Pseudomonadota bacterium]
MSASRQVQGSMLRRVLTAWDALTGKRSYDAAGGAPRWSPRASIKAPLAETETARIPVAARARYAAANDPHAHAAIEAIAANVAGPQGIRPQSAHPDPETAQRINQSFEAWATGDLDGAGGNFAALQGAAVRSMVRHGEAFLHFVTNERGALALRPLGVDQVDPSISRDLGAFRVIAGLEMDASGTVVAFHALTEPPDQVLGYRREIRRLPAEDVAHLMRPLYPGQARGLSWLTPALLAISDHNATRDALVMQAKTQALLGAFLHSADGTAGSFAGSADSETLNVELTPGGMHLLPPGFDVKFLIPNGGTASVQELLRAELRAIAAGIGVTYEQLSGDLSGVNYSSIRAGLVEFRRRVEMWQRQLLIPRLVRPVWRRWVTTEILAGRLDAPGFEADPEAWLGATFIKPAVPWVDPLKEIAAERDAVEAGFKSRREVIAGRGRDLEQVDAERAREPAVTAPRATAFEEADND